MPPSLSLISSCFIRGNAHFECLSLTPGLEYCSAVFANSLDYRQKGAIAIRQPYLRVVGMEQATDAHSVGGSADNTDEVRESIKNLLIPAKFYLFVL